MSLWTNLIANRAYVCNLRGQYDQAYALYQKAFSRKNPPVRALDYAGYTSLLIRRGAYQKAYEIITTGIELCKVNPKQKISIQSLSSQYVLVLWKLGRLDEAIAEQEQVHAKVPSVHSYGTLGYFYLLRGIDTGDYEQALSFNQSAVEYADDDATILDNLAQTYYRLEQYSEAKKYFELALAEKATQVDSLFYLAKTYDALGEESQALLWARKAAERKASHLSAVTDDMTRTYLHELQCRTASV